MDSDFLYLVLGLFLVILFLAPFVMGIAAIVQANKTRGTLQRQEQLIQQLFARLAELEHRQPGGPPPEPAPPPRPAVIPEHLRPEPPPPRPAIIPEHLRPEPPPAPAPAPPPPTAVPAAEVTPPPAPPLPPVVRMPAPPPAPEEAETLEQQIGKRWITWLGVLALFLSIGFFVKYAIDNAWIGPAARVALGVLFGLALLVAGDRVLRRGWRALGEGLLGGGLAIIYLSLYAGFALYHLMGAPAAFGAMVLLTALGMALAVIDNALSLAVLAVLGGLLSPSMVSTGGDARDVLMTYLLVLNLGVLGMAFFKQWRALDAVAFAGSWLLFWGWFAGHYRATAMTPTLLWLGVFYLVFLVLPFIYHLRNRVPVTVERFVMALLNAGIVFAFAVAILAPDHLTALGFIALGLSATSLLMGSLARTRLPDDPKTLFGFITLAVAFLTLAIPLQLRLYGITLLWAVEGPVLLYLGYRFRYVPVRIFGFLVLVLAVARLFAAHWPLHAGYFTPFVNANFLSAAAVALAIAAFVFIHARWRGEAHETDQPLMEISGIGGGLLGLLLLQTELGMWLDQVSQTRTGDFARAAVWAAGGLAFVAAGAWRRRRVVLGMGLLPLAIAFILGLIMYCGDNPLFLNPCFGTALFIVACGFYAWQTARRAGAPRDLQMVFFVLFEGFLFLALSLEVYVNAPRGIADSTRAQWVSQMALTLTWAVYAAVLLVIGFWRLSRGMRLTALCLFGVVAVKLLIADLATLDQIYRILAFFIAGLLMIGASYLYHHAEKRLAAAQSAPAEGAQP